MTNRCLTVAARSARGRRASYTAGPAGTAALWFAATGLCAAATISGRVTGHDGRPLPAAHVALRWPSGPAEPLLITAAAADGSFRLATTRTGLFLLRLTGVHHQCRDVPVLLEGDAELRLAVRLATVRYRSDPRPRVVVKGRSSVLDPMADGTFAIELAADERVVYQIEGVADGPVNGTVSAGFEFDGDRAYRSVLAACEGAVRIVFDPKQVVESQRPGEVELDGPAEWRRVVDALAGEPRGGGDAAGRVAEALWIRYLEAGGRDPAQIRRALVSIPPDSPLWWWKPWLAPAAVKALGGPEKLRGYAHEVMARLPHQEMQAAALWEIVSSAGQRGDFDEAQEYLELAGRLLPEHPRTKEMRSRFSRSRRILPGFEVPPFDLASIEDGRRISRDALRGRPYLLDFWATWCAPCIAAMPGLHELYRRYRSLGFEIVSVSADEGVREVARFRRERWPMPWFNAIDREGPGSALRRAFDVTVLPRSVLVARDGKVVATDLTGKALETAVRAAAGAR